MELGTEPWINVLPEPVSDIMDADAVCVIDFIETQLDVLWPIHFRQIFKPAFPKVFAENITIASGYVLAYHVGGLSEL